LDRLSWPLLLRIEHMGLTTALVKYVE